MQPLVSIIVLTYNSRKHLPALFDSIRDQTYSNVELLVIDNASQDDTISWLKSQTICSIDQLIENSENVWYAKANNQAAAQAKGDYILFCNDDIKFTPEYIERLMNVCSGDHTIGMIGGKLLKLTPAANQPIVDSAGLSIRRSRQMRNRGENQIDTGQFDEAQDVFGITGALLLASRVALDAVSTAGEYFDADFVAYKEDLDLSWRMQRAGYRVRYAPFAVAYHARTMQQSSLSDRSNTSRVIRSYSYRNHLWTIFKNDRARDFWRDSWAIIPYELAKLLYILIAEWSTVAMIPKVIKGLNTKRTKRITAHSNYKLPIG